MTAEKKEQVLHSFSSGDSPLQLVIATSAFGLGIDCQDVGRVTHWGVPSIIEEYVQETGRAGRSGHNAEAIIFDCKIGKNVTVKMKQYINNLTECRRKFLFLCFHERDIRLSGCDCCDICEKVCSCDKCKTKC